MKLRSSNFSLTPGFSRVPHAGCRTETVSTVFVSRLETVETVSKSLRSRNTPLKQGINERGHL
jgi:hypothetical protein